MSAYYPESLEITKEVIHGANSILLAQGFHLQNTRMKLLPSGDYEILVASADNVTPPVFQAIDLQLPNEKGRIIHRYGDYSLELDSVAACIAQAADYCRNDFQRTYLARLQEYFRTGSIAAHKKASIG